MDWAAVRKMLDISYLVGVGPPQPPVLFARSIVFLTRVVDGPSAVSIALSA